MAETKHRCNHCHKRRYIQARGICGTCYRTEGIKELYPAKGNGGSYVPSNNNDAGTIPPQPTDAPPGSLEKVLIMMDRVANGQLPNHPEDIVDREQHKG